MQILFRAAWLPATVAMVIAIAAASASARDSTGAFQTEVAIATTPYHGLEPLLAIGYDSRLGNGPLGFGWSLQGLSNIVRRSASDGVPRFDDADRFYLDGIELLACGIDPASPSVQRAACHFPSPDGQPYYARRETFERISLDRGAPGMAWTVWNRAGTRRLYRPSADGSAWHLARVEDLMGNAVDYSYAVTPADEPERLERIDYNGTALVLHWQPRPDAAYIANGHALLLLRQRLASIEVRVDGQMARTYALSYNQRPLTARSTLASIQEFGRDARIAADGSVSGTSLPASTYSYASDGTPASAGWLGAAQRLAPVTSPATDTPTPRYTGHSIDLDPGDCPTYYFQGFTHGDFDGDGRTDAMAILGCLRPADGILQIKAWQFGSHDRVLRGTVDVAIDEDFSDVPFDDRRRFFQVFPADTNGDGRQDLIVLRWRSAGGGVEGPLEIMVNVALSDGRGGLRWASPEFSATGWITRVIDAVNGPRCTVGDFAATRRAELACVFQSGGGTQFIGHAHSKRDGSLLPTAPVVLADSPWPSTPADVAMVTFPVTTGDVNGDGRDDVMVLAPNVAEMAACPLTETHPHCTVHLDLLTGLSDGVQFTFGRQSTPWSYDPGAIVTRLFAGDVDGDGRADYVVMNGTGDTLAEIDTARSFRDGSFALGSQGLPTALGTLGLQVALGDANGDGATDLLILARLDGIGLGCPFPFPTPGGVMSTVASNRDGTFALPERWDDCTRAPWVPVDWSAFAPSVGSFRAADTNGDGLADFLIGFVTPDRANRRFAIAFTDTPTAAPAFDARDWTAADLDGDGRTDLIRIASGATGTQVVQAMQTEAGFDVDPVALPTFDNLAPGAWRLADVDGDGRPDLVHVECETSLLTGAACDAGIDTFLGLAGGGYARQPHARLPGLLSGTDGNLASWRVADLDGNGRASLVFLAPARNGNGGLVVQAFSYDGDWHALVAAGPFNLGSQPPLSTALDDVLTWQAADIDGDGRTDFVHVIPDVAATRVSVLRSLGRNRWALSDVSVPNPPGHSWYLYPEVRSPTRWHVLDVNGDGLSDLYRTLPVSNGMVVQSLLSTGDGHWVEATFQPDFPTPDDGRQAAATDDWIGLPGSAAELPRLVRLDPVPGVPTQRLVTALEASSGGAWHMRRETVQDAADPIARARPAWIGATLKGASRRGVFRLDPAVQSGAAAVAVSALVSTPPSDRLTALRTQAGGRLEVAYAPFAAFQPRHPADGCLLPPGLDVTVVSTLTVTDGRTDGPPPSPTRFDYACPRWLSDMHRFDGWDEILATTPAAVHRDEGRTLDIYRHSSACGASLRATGPVDAQRHPIGQREYMEPYPAGDDPWACLPRRRITQVMETPQDLPLTIRLTYEYDRHGNITSLTRGTVVDDGTAASTLTATYAPNTGTWIVASPTNVELHAGNGAHAPLLGHRRYCYDGDTTATCDLAPTQGLVTRQIDIVELSSPDGRTTRFGYDEVGNLHSIRNANGHETTIDFDPYHRIYPMRITDAMGRDAGQVDWDPVLSRPRRIRNGTATPLVIDYDVVGRVQAVTLPAGGRMTRDYPDAGDPERQSILDTWHDGSGTDTWSRSYFDGLSRPYRLTRRASPFGRYERTVSYGDPSALPRESSSWHCVSWWPWCTPRDGVAETYRYDGLGRLASQAHADGTQVALARRMDQVGLLTERTDERGDVQGRVRDVLGRLGQATGQVDGTVARTHYRYDAADRITAAIDPMGNVVSIARNLAGEIVGVTDPDLGAQSMVRDGIGHLLSTTDAKQQTLEQSFDALERLKTRRWPDGRLLTLNYDEPGAGASQGRVTSMVDSKQAACTDGVVRRWAYDAAGQLAAMTVCVEGVVQRFGFGHDPLGRIHSITYPDGEEVFYGYDAAGRANRLSGIVDHVRFDASDRPRSLRMANGLQIATTYEQLRDALRSQTAWINGVRAYDEHYTHYDNLLLKSVHSKADRSDAAYEYDGLGRLTHVTGTGASDYHYDLAGNLDQRSGIGTLTYPPAGPLGCSPDGQTPQACATPHAVVQAGTTTFHYDANGAADVVTRADNATRRITWDADHSPESITDFDGSTIRFGYDGFGHRVSTTTAEGSHLYFDALAERTASGKFVKNYYLGGRRVASRTAGGTVNWIVADRVDSVRATVDEEGSVSMQARLAPFGDGGGPGAPTTQFAGHRIEPGMPAIVMGPRLYDPTLGRFLSPDGIVPSLGSTQALNRYAYVYNNPLSYLDPSGHEPVGIYGTFQSAPDGAWFGDDFGMLPMYTSGPPAMPAAPPPAFGPTAPSQGTTGSHTADKGFDWADFSLAMAKMSTGYVTGHVEAIVPGAMLLRREPVETFFDFGRAVGNLVGGIEGIGTSIELLAVSSGGEVLSAGAATPLAVGGVMVAGAVGANSTAAVGVGVTQIITMAMAGKDRHVSSERESETAPTREPQEVSVDKDWKPQEPCRNGCENAAAAIQKQIGGDIAIIKPKAPTRWLGPFRDYVDLNWSEHHVVVRDGKVFDLSTGSEGVPVNAYKQLFRFHENIEFGF